MKYLEIDISYIKGAGLTHQLSNLSCLLSYCYEKEYILIIPDFTLTGLHNNSRKIISNLSKYIDYSTIKINNIPYRVLLNKENVNHNDIISIKDIRSGKGLLRSLDLFKNTKSCDITYSYTEYILNISKNIVNLLGDFTIIHVRRTDRIKTKKQDIDTSPENILDIIKKYNNKNVYIMTNEKIEFFNKLLINNDYSIYFYNKFEELKKIKEEDNYLLFCIEKEIAKSAKIRISTFNTSNKNFYHDFLTDTPGWQ